MCGSDLGTQIAFFVSAVDTFLFHAFRGIAWNHYVPYLNPSDSFSDALHNTCSLMAEDTGEASFRVTSIESIDIGMTEGIRDDFDSDLAFFGGGNPNFFVDHRLLSFISNCGLAQNRLRFF